MDQTNRAAKVDILTIVAEAPHGARNGLNSVAESKGFVRTVSKRRDVLFAPSRARREERECKAGYKTKT